MPLNNAHFRGSFYYDNSMSQLNLFSDLFDDNNDKTEIEYENDSNTKICRICKVIKSTDEFFLDRGKLYSKCKECFKKYNQDLKTVHQNAPEKPDRCECCNKIPVKWACDHHPNSTIFRGWVCWECNNAAGSVGDSYEGAVNLFNYLYQRQHHK